MSEALVCLTETEQFYSQDLCNESNFAYDAFSINTPKDKLPKDTSATSESLPQKENTHAVQKTCSGDSSALLVKQTLPRKREASNILVECVKRRDNLRNIDLASEVPCKSYGCDMGNFSPESMTEVSNQLLSQKKFNLLDECATSVLTSMDVALVSSSATDSGIDSSKNSSPAHSIDTASSCSLEEVVCQNLMDIDHTETTTQSFKEDNAVVCETEPSLKSVASFAAEDLSGLHLTDVSTLPAGDISENCKSPIIQSLFSCLPSIIYFSFKDELVSAMPDPVLQLMKWKLSSITPVVIKDTILKAGFTLLQADTTDSWLGTWGKHLKCAVFKRFKHFQKVNHFPGGFHLGRKDRLWENYSKMQKSFGTEAYSFFPETYILPADLKLLKTAWGSEADKCWIVKPCASARGTGVKVIYKWSQVPKDRPVVVQHYISDPYLINGSKFDLRLYVLISSVEPLRVYVYEDGLVRFASQKYSLANKSFANRYIHLTNYSINRRSSSYTSNDDENMCQGHKWSLKSFWTYMSNSGIDVAKIQETITDMIVKTVISAEGPLCRMLKAHAKSSYNCFELFGFDIMLDKDLHPWLLEVNISPSLHTKSILDTNVKGPLVKDMLNIAGFEIPQTSDDPKDNGILSYVGSRHKPVHNRRLTIKERRKHAMYTYKHSDVESDILSCLTNDDLYCLIESEDEYHRRGSFTRVFPTHSTHKYFCYFDHIRYYNVLLDAWEKVHHAHRNQGVIILQEACKKLFQPETNEETIAQSSTQLKTSELSSTIIEL